MARKYINFIVLCIGILLVDVIFSVPVSLEVHSVGPKPSFLLALFLLITLLATTVIASYASYLAWFHKIKARANIETTMERLANQFGRFRFLVITNVTFTFWFLRLISPVLALFSFGLFLLVLFSAF